MKWLDRKCQHCGRKHRELKGRFYLSTDGKGEDMAFRWAGPRVMEDDPQRGSRAKDYCLEFWKEPLLIAILKLHDGVEIKELG